jgi:demethylmenaquinone methyltransferase / 2-methoxy-6-polyprenyl-1,4-benzoquinol methylase
MKNTQTHFGYKQIPTEEKVEQVGQVFSSVAQQYDIMNDFMSFGLHRLWKEIAIKHLALRPHHKVLDLAGGTGDLTAKIHPLIKAPGSITLSDINADMLEQGKQRLLDQGIFHSLEFVLANAEELPFADNQFDRVIMGFGLRNVTHKDRALKNIYRTLKPGGRLIVLEFSEPKNNLLKTLYDFYSFNCIPKIGKWVAQDEDSYQYLVESIRMHPNQEKLKTLMQQQGFEDITYHNLTGGIVAIHKGFKY